MNLKPNKKIITQASISAFGIITAIAISGVLIKTKPQAKKQDKPQEIPLVETITAEKTNADIVIKGQGQIEPAQSITLLSEVGGKIIHIHQQMTKGGIVKKGDILLKIDPKEYKLTLAQKNSLLASAKLNLALEKAQHEVAKEEYARRSNKEYIDETAKALATRTYNYEKAQAEYEAALADVERAKLNLEKTIIRSPIDAMVAKTDAQLNEFIFANKNIATIYGTHEFLVEVSVPVSELAHINIAATSKVKGSQAIVSQLSMNGISIKRVGEVKKLLPDLGQLGHMARLVVSINDPLNLNNIGFDNLPMLAGAKVQVKINGRQLKDVYAIPRSALNSDESILVVDEEQTISSITPKIVRRDKKFVYAVGTNIAGKNIITTKSGSTQVGQKIRLANNN